MLGFNLSKILSMIWSWTLQVSYVLCLFICLAAILMYIFGFKKYAKWAPASIGIYILLQAIGSAL